MASQNFSVSDSKSRYTLTLTLTEGTQNVTNNQTPLTYKLVLKANTAYNFELYKIGRTVTLNGTTVYNVARSSSASLSIADYGSLTLAEGSTTITHNNDGTKSISVAYSMDMASASYTPGAMSGSGTMTLTTIPRATQPTLSPASVTMGSNMTINLPRAATSFTHNVYYSFGSLSNKQIASGATTSATWSPVPLDLANQIPNAKSGTGTITVDTYNNGTKIGTKTASFTATVPDNASTKPTCTLAISPTGNPSWVTSGMYIQGKTKVSATITGTPKYSSPISTYKLTVDGAVTTSTSGSLVSGLLSKSGNISVKGAVVNSRSFSSEEATKTIKVEGYAKPKIFPYLDKIICQRCDANGNLTDSGENLFLQMTCLWIPLSDSKNTASITCTVVSGGGTTTNEYTLTPHSLDEELGSGIFGGKVNDITLNKKKAYLITITITDRFGEKDELTFTIPTEDVALHLGKKGNKAAFGKYAEVDNALEIASDWTLMVSGNATGRVLGLGAVPAIPKNADLNDPEYRKIGVYAVTTDAIGATIGNRATSAAGTLRVFSSTGEGRDVDGAWINLIQEYVQYQGHSVYRRWIRTDGDGNWTYGTWVTYLSSYNIKDYITERSIANIAAASPRNATTWYITKWNSGLVELHARVGFSNVAVTGTWGTMYSSYIMNSNITYPVTFQTAPMCQVTPEYSSGGNYWISVCDYKMASATNTPMYQAVRPSSATVNVILNYYVRGYI